MEVAPWDASSATGYPACGYRSDGCTHDGVTMFISVHVLVEFVIYYWNLIPILIDTRTIDIGL